MASYYEMVAVDYSGDVCVYGVDDNILVGSHDSSFDSHSNMFHKRGYNNEHTIP
jgi:hypothetical protein